MRTETFDQIVLYHADCRDMLPLLAPGHVIVTDPVWPNCPHGLLHGSNNPDGLWFDTMQAVNQPLRIIAVMRSDSDPRILRHVPDHLGFFRTIMLPYAVPSYVGRKLCGDEVAYWFGTAVKFQRGRQLVPGRGPIAQPNDRPENGHPCSRVQKHFNWLVEWCSDEGETIVDPFMGSATTAIAALHSNRPFFGMEIDGAYFDLACRRVEKAMRQTDMFSACKANIDQIGGEA